MKKLLTTLILLIYSFILVSCSNNDIVPKGYTECKIYSDTTIEQIGHTIQYNIYKYEGAVNLEKNHFLEKVTEDDLLKAELLLIDYENKLNEYDQNSDNHEFKENFDVSINNISAEDYIFIDHKINEYFMIYYFETSNNTLYYLQLIYKNVN